MISEELSIRRATIEDLQPLLLLSRQTFWEAFGAQNTPQNMAAYMNEAFNETQLRSELHDPDSQFFLVYADNEAASQPVGYAKLRSSKKQTALEGHRAVEIQRIYVLERMKGKKIGKCLMQTCLETAREQGYEMVWLGVWEHNPHAIAFYKKWGFEPFSSYIFHFGDEDQTDLLFRKWLVEQ